VLDCHFNTPVYFEGHLYGFHGRQETGQELRCLELNTGEVKWKAPLPAGSVTIADGKLLVLTERGELLVGKASPSAWQINYRAQVGGAETRALPAIAGKYFYVRDKRQLSCVQLP
jgi:outer membrane protein assembly factor BamB